MKYLKLLCIVIFLLIIQAYSRDGNKLLEKYSDAFLVDFIKPEYKYEFFHYENEGVVHFEISYYKKIVIRVEDQVSDDCLKDKEYWQYITTDYSGKTNKERFERDTEHSKRIAEGHIKNQCRKDSLDYLADKGIIK